MFDYSLQSTINGFNPRICKRCDLAKISDLHIMFVSIHASVKDATDRGERGHETVDVSIHASVKDATGITIRKCSIGAFQSTHL